MRRINKPSKIALKNTKRPHEIFFKASYFFIRRNLLSNLLVLHYQKKKLLQSLLLHHQQNNSSSSLLLYQKKFFQGAGALSQDIFFTTCWCIIRKYLPNSLLHYQRKTSLKLPVASAGK